jgi:hypothetical protein
MWKGRLMKPLVFFFDLEMRGWLFQWKQRSIDANHVLEVRGIVIPQLIWMISSKNKKKLLHSLLSSNIVLMEEISSWGVEVLFHIL